MKTIIYKSSYETLPSISDFLDAYYCQQMDFLASDLLVKGLSPAQISDAVFTAIRVANSSHINARKHFKPMYSSIGQEIIKDCKLSHLGYGLVLMNADPKLTVVGDFQVSVLKEFLKTAS